MVQYSLNCPIPDCWIRIFIGAASDSQHHISARPCSPIFRIVRSLNGSSSWSVLHSRFPISSERSSLHLLVRNVLFYYPMPSGKCRHFERARKATSSEFFRQRTGYAINCKWKPELLGKFRESFWKINLFCTRPSPNTKNTEVSGRERVWIWFF